MATTAYDAKLCSDGAQVPIGAPDDDIIFGQTIQPALNHIEYTPVARSCAKETSQESFGATAMLKYVCSRVRTP